MSGPVLPHGSPLTLGPRCARFVVQEMFQGMRTLHTSNPLKKDTIPCYAASERQADVSLTSRSAGTGGFRLAGSLESATREAGERQRGCGPHAVLAAG